MRKPPTRKADQQKLDERQKTTVLEAITAPLGFFVLALLIVETFLASVMIGTNLESSQKMVGMWAGIGLFVYVTLIVFVLVWFKPSNLTFDKHAHLLDRGKIPYGMDKEPIDPEKLLSGQKESGP